MAAEAVRDPDAAVRRITGRGAGHNGCMPRRRPAAGGRIGRRAPLPRSWGRFIVPARFACKITICEGAAAMVAKKTAARVRRPGDPRLRLPRRSAAARRAREDGGEQRDGKAAAKKRPEAEQAGTDPGAQGHQEGRPKKATKKAAEKTVAKKAAAKKTAQEHGRNKKTPRRTRRQDGEKTAAKKTRPRRAPPEAAKNTAKKAGAAQAAKQTGATRWLPRRRRHGHGGEDRRVPKARVAAAAPGELAVRPGEDPWTPEEVDEARAELTARGPAAAHRARVVRGRRSPV